MGDFRNHVRQERKASSFLTFLNILIRKLIIKKERLVLMEHCCRPATIKTRRKHITNEIKAHFL
jgi:hypothetical protein